MATIGYARVSTGGQRAETQVAALRAAGCTIIHEEVASGANKGRPVLAKILKAIQPDDILLVVRLDRLARSLAHLLETIEHIGKRKAHVRSLNDPVDTTTPQGVFAVQIMGAVAELERGLAVERTKEGLAAARRRGRIGGNRKAKYDPEHVRAREEREREKYIEAASPHELIPIIQRMRAEAPRHSWADVAVAINAAFPEREPWNRERLTRLAKYLVKRGSLDQALMKPLRKAPPETPAMRMIVAMCRKEPTITLLELARRIEHVGLPTPRRGAKWHVSTVAYMRKLAVERGYLPRKTLR